MEGLFDDSFGMAHKPFLHEILPIRQSIHPLDASPPSASISIQSIFLSHHHTAYSTPFARTSTHHVSKAQSYDGHLLRPSQFLFVLCCFLLYSAYFPHSSQFMTATYLHVPDARMFLLCI